MGGPGSGKGGRREGAGRPKKDYSKERGQRTINFAVAKKRKADESAEREQEEAERRRLLREERDREKAEQDKRDRAERLEREEGEVAEVLALWRRDNQSNVENRNVAAGGEGDGGGDGDDDDDEEDYHSDDDYEEDDDEGNISISDNNNSRKSRASARYKPPPGSTLYNYLETRKAELTAERSLNTGQAWFPPEHAALGKEVNPMHFCKEAAWIHRFAPFYSRRLPEGKQEIKDYTCIHCNEKGNLESNGCYWRPQHYFDREVWLLHRRLVCKKKNGCGCGRTFAEFHPKFMEQLPSAVVESFPFMVTASGIGMHRAMMFQFLFLATKGVLFSTYAKSINEMKMARYWTTHGVYLDLLADTVVAKTKLKTMDDFTPRPFPPYKSVGEYNGILLKPRLLKKLFLQFMRSRETYMQESFQLHPDESEASDHSFKFAKQVTVFNRGGRVWLCTYDSMSLGGNCTFNFELIRSSLRRFTRSS